MMKMVKSKWHVARVMTLIKMMLVWISAMANMRWVVPEISGDAVVMMCRESDTRAWKGYRGGRNNCSRSLSIGDIATKMVPLCLVYNTLHHSSLVWANIIFNNLKTTYLGILFILARARTTFGINDVQRWITCSNRPNQEKDSSELKLHEYHGTRIGAPTAYKTIPDVMWCDVMIVTMNTMVPLCGNIFVIDDVIIHFLSSMVTFDLLYRWWECWRSQPSHLCVMVLRVLAGTGIKMQWSRWWLPVEKSVAALSAHSW